MLTWLAERGVPYEQRQMLAGHSPQGTTAKNYEHLTPEYLKTAVLEIDEFFRELSAHTHAITEVLLTPSDEHGACGRLDF